MAIAEQEIVATKLPLDSLEIKNYRAFKELTIPKLARVNLITGKNNVGKTSLLEAVYLYANRMSVDAVWDLLVGRNQLALKVDNDIGSLLDAISFMFHDISPRDLNGTRRTDFKVGSLSHPSRHISVQLIRSVPASRDETPGLDIATSGELQHYYRVQHILDPVARRILLDLGGLPPCRLLTSSRVTTALRGDLWDKIALSSLKQDVVAAVQIVESSVEDISFLGEANDALGRVPYAKVDGKDYSLPLSVFGEGSVQAFTIMLAMVNCGGGILLVDEIENGLHHSIQTQVWRVIFDLAQRLNIQVFATTHSWDCVRAFQKALADVDEREGVVINLQQKSGNIVTTTFDKRDLGIVVEDGIEVR
jgi:predicted ATPase